MAGVKMDNRKILAIFFLSQVIFCSTASKLHDERRTIVQFCNYFNTISRIKLDNMLEMSQMFVQQVLNTIPFEDRGNSADMLQRFIEDAERVQLSMDNDEKRGVLLDMQKLVAAIQSEMVKQEPEDLIIQQGLRGMFELLARMSLEERRFGEKFVRASDLLSQKFTSEGKQRHAMLFDTLTAYKSAENIVKREDILRQFRQIKADYLGVQDDRNDMM